MKALNVDWEEFLEYLSVLEEAPFSALKLLLSQPPGQSLVMEEFGSHGEALLAAGILREMRTSGRVCTTKEFGPTFYALRLMDRHRVLENPEGVEGYGDELWTKDELEYMVANPTMYSVRPTVEPLGDVRYLQGFLRSRKPASWEHARCPEPDLRMRSSKSDSTLLLTEAQASKDLKSLLQLLEKECTPVHLAELVSRLSKVPAKRALHALCAGLRYGLCFVGIYDERASVGLHPRIRYRLDRKRLPEPERTEPDDVYSQNCRMLDMEAVVVFCSEPRRVRTSDLSLFAKAKGELLDMLQEIPDWLMPLLDSEERLEGTLQDALHGELVEYSKDRKHLQATDAGLHWLSLDATGKAKGLLDPFRLPDWDARARRLTHPVDRTFVDAGVAVRELKGPVKHSDYLEWMRPEVPPLGKDETGYDRYTGDYLSDDDREAIWTEAVESVLLQYLLPIGGLIVGSHRSGLTIELSPVGRYLLRATDELEIAETSEGGVIVQPDFEVVFLSPNPALEARFTRLGERLGTGLGALFRLTRKSIQAAHEAGMSGEVILETLREASSVPVPDNVLHEVERWCDQSLTAAWEPAHLIRCPDEETADRIQQAGGKRLERLGPLVLAVLERKELTKMTKRLREGGVFVELPEEKPPKKKRAKRLRQYW